MGLKCFELHCVKKVPTFNLSVTLSNLNRFSKFLHCGKAYEICYKTHTTLPSHLKYVATLPWEIKNSNFLPIFSRCGRNCIFIAPNFVIRLQILIFFVFKIVNCSPYWLQIKFSMSLFFYLFTFAINLWHRKFVTADVVAVFINSQHGMQR